MNKNSELTSTRISKLPAAMLATLVLSLALPGAATAASSVKLDGIFTPVSDNPSGLTEYTGGDANGIGGFENGSIDLLWFNDHNSIYNSDDGNMNPLLWEINTAANGKFSLNVFFEVPAEARRMIWDNDCTYNGTLAGSGCGALAPGDDTKYLDAYQAGSHHDDDKDGIADVKMDYGTQVNSEYFRLNSAVLTGSDSDKDKYESIFEADWTPTDAGTSGNPMWATSLDYLLGNGICDDTQCLEFDRTASIEVMWTEFASLDAAKAFLGTIDNMQLHLSDEATGIPDVPDIPGVPVPAAFWLFGTALIGFIGISRRTNLS